MTGISSYGAYLPRDRLPASAYEAVWNRFQGRIEAKAVPRFDEDAVTMGIDAARDVVVDDPDLLAVASTTWPQPGTLASGPVARALGLDGDLRTMEFGTSWKAGLEALDAALGRGGLAIASDAPRTDHADDADHVLGAGAAAVATDGDPVAHLLSDAHVVDARLPAKFDGEDGVTDLQLGGYTVEGFQDAVGAVVEDALEQADLVPDDVSHAVLPQDDVKTSWRTGERLGFADDQLTSGFLVERVGFAGVAAPLVGLAGALDESDPGDRVLVSGYGYGHGATAFVFEATDAIADESANVREQLADSVEIDYGDYLKRRGGN